MRQSNCLCLTVRNHQILRRNGLCSDCHRCHVMAVSNITRRRGCESRLNWIFKQKWYVWQERRHFLSPAWGRGQDHRGCDLFHKGIPVLSYIRAWLLTLLVCSNHAQIRSVRGHLRPSITQAWSYSYSRALSVSCKSTWVKHSDEVLPDENTQFTFF